MYIKLNLIHTQAPHFGSWTAVKNDYYYQPTVACQLAISQPTHLANNQQTCSTQSSNKWPITV